MLNVRRLGAGQFMLKAFRFVVRNEAVDQRGQLAFHYVTEVVQRQADAVIGNAILREIVGADFFRAVTRFDLIAALRAQRGLLLLVPFHTDAREEHAWLWRDF